MPRGGRGSGRKGSTGKGRSRHFTSEEELRSQQERERKDRQWRQQKGIEEESDEEKDEGTGKSDIGVKTSEGHGAPGELPPSSSEDEDSDDEEEKPKGVQHLIDVQNPNRGVKQNKKVTDLSLNDDSSKPQLSRREREAIEKQQAKERYERLHMAGKTDEAQSDLARLAIIRKQREEAAKKRAEEDRKKAEESKAKSKKS